MKIIIYTRPPEHASSITRQHWQSALQRNGLSDLSHEILVCHSDVDMASQLMNADMIVSSRADLRTLVSPTNTRLKMIFFAFTGVDHLAPFDWVPNDTYIVNNSGASAVAMGEYAIFAMQLLANGMVRNTPPNLTKTASQRGFASLSGMTATIIGTGGVGCGIAAMCKAFRMNVRGVRRSGAAEVNFDEMHQSTELETAIHETDFVVIACPVTAETRDLIDAPLIGRMKSGSYLINVARGAILDEEALCEAVSNGAIGGAILDVVRGGDHARVHSTPGILVTPHVSGDDPHHYIDRSLDVLMANLRQFLENERPHNAINLELGY